ncbi:MAG: hypothetical protein JWO67_933 [Streptosporangiaceae bacterium]|nr:hypothetical protein [Streptosporangiaceae bacterium]
MPAKNGKGRVPYNRTSAAGVIARAGRAHEDPHEMTVTATEVRLGKFIAIALKQNPDLDPLQAAKAGRLLLRAEMLRLSRKSAEARAPKTSGEPPQPRRRRGGLDAETA